MKSLLIIFTLVVISGCATGPRIDTRYTSISQDSRVQFLILHYTAGDFPVSLKTLTEGPVSSHYLVDDATAGIYRLVDENRRAYHAGESYWKGSTRLNASSIGIEIVNPGYQDTPEGRVWFDFPKAQISAVIELVKQVVNQHEIKPERILAHSDIAPQRKVDPGPRFPWKLLADAGLIPWPDAGRVALRQIEFERQLPEIAWFQKKLAEHGYAVPQNAVLDQETRNVLAVFQMKYRPARYDGTPDPETAAILDELTSMQMPAFRKIVSLSDAGWHWNPDV
ncbi:MAG: N-acetylmuramoyl-L-alanine amidase [Rhodocyclaceae bacterium]|nr:MAG: N-acetylmuramoyl-L-alanine amidase [Rhodocyclaceae bacterium]